MSHLGQRLSALIDGELSHSQRERVLSHLARCEDCRREAVALRALKRRMHTLGEHTATDDALVDRLVALASVTDRPARGRRWLVPGPAEPGTGRPRWAARSLTMAGLMLIGIGLPAAAFVAGGVQQEPGPSVTPAVDTFIAQHSISAGEVPAMPEVEAPPSRPGPGTPPARTPTRRLASRTVRAGTGLVRTSRKDAQAAPRRSVAARRPPVVTNSRPHGRPGPWPARAPLYARATVSVARGAPAW